MAVLVKSGETSDKTYQLSVSNMDETLVDVKTVIGVFSNSDQTPKMTMTITNHPEETDKEKDKLFSVNVEFTASIESRKEKKTMDFKTVTWNFYRFAIKQAA